MSKTTPEEARQLATKHLGEFWSGRQMVQLAALIDEVRGVDAEPSITVHKDASGVVWLNFVAPSGTKAMLSLNNVINDRSNTFTTRAMADAINAYTHPAPPQPAAPVELPVVAWFADDGDCQGLALKENVALRSCEPGTVAQALVKLSDAQAAIAAS